MIDYLNLDARDVLHPGIHRKPYRTGWFWVGIVSLGLVTGIGCVYLYFMFGG